MEFISVQILPCICILVQRQLSGDLFKQYMFDVFKSKFFLEVLRYFSHLDLSFCNLGGEGKKGRLAVLVIKVHEVSLTLIAFNHFLLCITF